ncbi:LuxR C-terminal-related transcriptional regulator [Kitasatospora sp. NPDC051914]|uniref:helix-turn-helix transcriptional regulator n=1 Tax=Kitasatospora sp. NPDC051914 TaxID=3154945 RepID=UPI00342B837F
MLCGPPGAGRTAPADRAVRTAAAAGALTLTAHGHPAETGLPYAALDLLAAELAAAELTAGPAEPAGAPAAARAGRLLGLLRDLTARRPVLLAVDDVHHWDEPSRAALAVAARRLGPRCPAALLLTADTHHGPDPHLDGLPRLDLGPLPAAAAAALVRGAVTHGLATATVVTAWALARRDATAGRHDRAATRLLALTAPGPAQGHFALRLLAVPCLVEACVRAGRTEEARPAVREFSAWASGGAGDHARALAARCRALLAEADGGTPDTVVDLHREALTLHAAADSVLEQARTALQLGKALRRRRRPGQARHHLREALEGFEHCGARPWAEEARTELRAAGADHGGPAVRPPVGALTAQQAHIARKAADGATNNEIARQLSLSPRTVEHHLRNIFATLGIRSRTQLGPVLAARHA